MPEFTQLDSTKSMMRNLPPNGVAGLQRSGVRLLQALAAPARHDDRQRAAGEPADVASGSSDGAACSYSARYGASIVPAMLPVEWRRTRPPHEQRPDRQTRAPCAPDLRAPRRVRHGDPFAVLGAHERDGMQVVRGTAAARDRGAHRSPPATYALAWHGPARVGRSVAAIRLALPSVVDRRARRPARHSIPIRSQSPAACGTGPFH